MWAPPQTHTHTLCSNRLLWPSGPCSALLQASPNSRHIPDRMGMHPRYIADSSTFPGARVLRRPLGGFGDASRMHAPSIRDSACSPPRFGVTPFRRPMDRLFEEAPFSGDLRDGETVLTLEGPTGSLGSGSAVRLFLVSPPNFSGSFLSGCVHHSYDSFTNISGSSYDSSFLY